MSWTLRSEHCPTLLMLVNDSYDHHTISDIQATGRYHQKTCNMNIKTIRSVVKINGSAAECISYQIISRLERLATGWTVRGWNPGGGPDFPHPSRPALGPAQPPIQWVSGLSLQGKDPIAPRLKEEQSYTSTPPMGLLGLFQGELFFYLYLLVLVFQLEGRRYLRLQGIQQLEIGKNNRLSRYNQSFGVHNTVGQDEIGRYLPCSVF